jgi:hypothetical protein
MTPLTPIELQILATLIAETERLGFQPAITELAVVTRPGVHGYLQKIAAKGWITQTGLARAIVISDEAREAVKIYLAGDMPGWKCWDCGADFEYGSPGKVVEPTSCGPPYIICPECTPDHTPIADSTFSAWEKKNTPAGEGETQDD